MHGPSLPSLDSVFFWEVAQATVFPKCCVLWRRISLCLDSCLVCFCDFAVFAFSVNLMSVEVCPAWKLWKIEFLTLAVCSLSAVGMVTWNVSFALRAPSSLQVLCLSLSLMMCFPCLRRMLARPVQGLSRILASRTASASCAC